MKICIKPHLFHPRNSCACYAHFMHILCKRKKIKRKRSQKKENIKKKEISKE